MRARQIVKIELAPQVPRIINGYWHEWIDGEWVNTGIKAKGEDGKGVSILGSKDNESQLPTTAEIGDAYLINGDMWVYDGVKWTNVGKIKGEDGKDGIDGAPGEDGKDGNDGQSSFKSTAFIRQNAAPSLPSGGSYSNPKPTTLGWSDGVPAGSDVLWASTRIFTSDGKTPQQTQWTTPQRMADTVNLAIMYSSAKENAGNPTTHPSNWTSVASTEAIWMATRINRNGQWDAWTVTKIKGEDGKDGYTPIKGTDYFDGKDGQDGTSEHLHIRYSMSPDGSNFDIDPSNKLYIGIATSTTGVAPTLKTKYNWTLIKGSDGVKGEKGTDGESRYLHIKYSDNGTSFTANMGETLGSWIGMYVDEIEEDSTRFDDYTWRKVDGEDGKDGVGISSIVEYYQVSASNTVAPTTWIETIPALTAANKYLWNYEKITYTNSVVVDTKKKVIGVYGDKGADGGDGKGITSIVNYYLATASSSGVTTGTAGWTTGVQAVSASEKYLWNYEVVNYTSGLPTTTAPTIIGAYGDKGEDGKDGKDGVDGKDGENPRPEDMPIGYMAGKWSVDGYKGEPYKRTKTSFPIVELNKYYYYLIRNFTGMNHLTPPNQDFGTPTSHWALADNFDMIIAEAVVSKFGKIGGAVFVGANLISQWGLDENGNQVDTYENYGLKNSDGIPLFTPNLDFDFFDGIIKMGRNIKMGVENGRSLLTFYDDNGLPIYDLSPNGISKISARSSSWTPMHLIYLGANYEYVLKNSVPKSKYKNSNKESAEAVTYYRYTSKMVAGQVTDELNDGVIFTNKSTTSTRIPIGVYCEKIVGMHGEYLADGELPDMHEHNETVSLNSPIYFKHLWQPFNGRKGAEVIAYWNE